jgi:hypothetical protein
MTTSMLFKTPENQLKRHKIADNLNGGIRNKYQELVLENLLGVEKLK